MTNNDRFNINIEIRKRAPSPTGEGRGEVGKTSSVVITLINFSSYEFRSIYR